MKGISTIIATLLMLIIVIAIAGLAYSYISGLWVTRTAVVLSVDPDGTQCIGETITVGLRNDGTVAVSPLAVRVIARTPDGTLVGSCSPSGIPAMSANSCSITRPVGTPAGTYSISAVSGSDITSGTVWCSSTT